MGMALLGIAMGSAALSLGRAQGLALVGQPLDLRIQVQFDNGEDLQAACLTAEVFYGDSQVDPSRVSVALDATTADPASRSAPVRVRAAAAVNEPVVTVQLRSGCQIRSSKRYTLLADLPTKVVEAPERTPSRSLAPVAAADVSRSGGLVSLQKPVPQGDAPAALRSDTPRKAKTAPLVAPTVAAQPPAQARTPKSTKTRARAHLKLDALDLLMERDPVLRATDELLSAPQEGGSQRAEAAALWRALNATPEQILREEVQAQRVAVELKSLYTTTNANQKGLMELVAKVERADSERYANGLVYSLLALCAIGLVALLWVWQHMRSMVPAPDWKQSMDAGDSLMVELLHANSSRTPTKPPAAKVTTKAARTAVPSAPMPLTEVDVDLGQINPSWNKDLLTRHFVDPWATPASAAPSAWRTLEVPTLPNAEEAIDFSASVSPVQRTMDTEELEDIRQQAEFFVSLGRQEKAVDILITRVAQCGESSPLVCLDLLKLYHALGRETEYDFMRTEFHHWFTGRIPEFAEFGNEGRALERYPQVMERIVNMWPGTSVLAYIEDCLYQHTGALSGQAFDLQAYRDLLLLHTVAKRIIRMADDNGARNAHVPDMVRIPARGGNNPTRPGGLREDDDDDDGSGFQVDINTNSAPLGPMKVPPAPVVGPAEPEVVASVHDKTHTDFNFLNLR